MPLATHSLSCSARGIRSYLCIVKVLTKSLLVPVCIVKCKCYEYGSPLEESVMGTCVVGRRPGLRALLTQVLTTQNTLTETSVSSLEIIILRLSVPRGCRRLRRWGRRASPTVVELRIQQSYLVTPLLFPYDPEEHRLFVFEFAMEDRSSNACRSQSLLDPYHGASTEESSLRPRHEFRIFKFDEELAQEERQRQSRASLDVVRPPQARHVDRCDAHQRKSQDIKTTQTRRVLAGGAGGVLQTSSGHGKELTSTAE
jgi:hypothetical protein